jgi:hypothetical protein
MQNKNKYLVLISILFALVLISCGTQRKCVEPTAEGNLGCKVNSIGDDYSPSFFNERLFFLSSIDPKNKRAELYSVDKTGNDYDNHTKIEDLPLSQFGDYSTPSFFTAPNGTVEVYFSAPDNKGKKTRKIYYSKLLDDKWDDPAQVTEINSDKNDSYPSISPDGSMLVFASDRAGSIGYSDIYVSKRQKNGKWSKPENLTKEINTTAADITPHIGRDGSLYFASNGYRPNTGYDIIKAQKTGDGKWGNPQILPEPYNSESDDKDPITIGAQLVFASKRDGGSGGYDLYGFQVCGPVYLEAIVDNSAADFANRGSFLVRADEGEVIYNISNMQDNSILLELEPYRHYELNYSNPCIPAASRSYPFYAECSDSSTIKFVLNIKGDKERENDFSFAKYEAPFFVTGYYMPNTSDNLNDLKLLFQYNLFGTNATNKYIENPGERYDEYVPVVEQAFAEAVELLKSYFAANDDCHRNVKSIDVTITGYTDPRPIAAEALYHGSSIEDSEMDVFVENGAPMTNELLSLLRAYYTAKTLQKLLSANQTIDEYYGKIYWHAIGKGVDMNESRSLDLRRRIEMHIDTRE